MAWNESRPASGSKANSAQVKTNWDAIEQSLETKNLLADPTFLIWAAGASADPSHWTSSGAGAAIAQELTELRFGANAAKLTYGGATAKLSQDILPTSDYDSYFDGKFFSVGAWVFTNSVTSIGFDDGDTPTYSSVVASASTWTWKTHTHQVGSGTKLAFDLKVDSGGFAIISAPSVVYGLIPPQEPLFPSVIRGMFGTTIAGDPVTAGSDIWTMSYTRPFIVDYVQIECLSIADTSSLVIDIHQASDIGGGGTTMFASPPAVLSTTSRVGLAPDGTYQFRCFAAGSDSSVTNGILSVHVDNVPSGGGAKSPTVLISARAFSRPQEILLSALSHK